MMPKKLKSRRPTMLRKQRRRNHMMQSTLLNIQLALKLLQKQRLHLPQELVHLQRPQRLQLPVVIMLRKKLSMLKSRKPTMPRKLRRRRHMIPSTLPNTELHPLENPRPTTMTSISRSMKKNTRLDCLCTLPDVSLMTCLSPSITISRQCRTTMGTHTTKTITWQPIIDE